MQLFFKKKQQLSYYIFSIISNTLLNKILAFF